MPLVPRCELEAELTSLKKGENIAPKSRLLNFSPFLDEDGLIRVGGKLHNSQYSYQQKHSIISPKSHPNTELIIAQEHHSNLHGGV